jgi:LAO/AO transport system kinase
MHALGLGHKIAVLSIDPSSSISGGSILGDKTRMEKLARQPQAFIRPSPAGRTLGGVARRTRETLLLCEAAGFDTVIVETVGVGQSETTVAEMTDMFILLLLPGGGDELQGIKRGIMELADLVLINKADGELIAAARRAAADYRNALRLLQPRSANWQVPVEMCSALTGDGIAAAWQTIRDYRQALTASGEIGQRRARQARTWLWQETADDLLPMLKAHPEIRRRLPELEAEVEQGQTLPGAAARRLIAWFLDKS